MIRHDYDRRVLISENFQTFYSEYFQDRWPGLLEALFAKEIQVARPNGFSKDFGHSKIVKEIPAGEVPRGEDGLLGFYIMDPASIYAAKALNVQDGDKVLDMCAAPGGKTLILAEALRSSGELIANELSQDRRERLKKVIQQYIPRDIRDRVWVSGKDGGKFALSAREEFDRILIDAPCSGERHLLRTPSEMKEWKISRSEKLAQRQYALLTAALIACKSQGKILYSTCALSPLENDGVIDRLLTKKEGFKILECNLPVAEAEKTKYGIQFLPDRCGYGPIYYCLLEKN